MKKFSVKNITKSTPAKYVKIGMSLVAVATFVCGYGLTQGDKIVGYIGLAIGAVGTFVANCFNDDKK